MSEIDPAKAAEELLGKLLPDHYHLMSTRARKVTAVAFRAHGQSVRKHTLQECCAEGMLDSNARGGYRRIRDMLDREFGLDAAELIPAREAMEPGRG